MFHHHERHTHFTHIHRFPAHSLSQMPFCRHKALECVFAVSHLVFALTVLAELRWVLRCTIDASVRGFGGHPMFWGVLTTTGATHVSLELAYLLLGDPPECTCKPSDARP